MTYAFRCANCPGEPPPPESMVWRILRTGDAAVTWACDVHLGAVVREFIRPDRRHNEFTVTLAVRADELPGVEPGKLPELRDQLARVINHLGLESSLGDTPDFIVADFLSDVLEAYGRAVLRRKAWHEGSGDYVRCPMVCPHGDQCRLPKGHEDGCSHAGCDCNEPSAPMTKGALVDPETDPSRPDVVATNGVDPACLGTGAPKPIDPASGQHKSYWVLSDEERAKGFVRPVRRSYMHETCETVTTMTQAIAETYARDPRFYGSTFCVGCRQHYPVGESGQFVWVTPDGKLTSVKVGT